MLVISPHLRIRFQSMIYHLLFCLVTLILDVFTSIRVAPDEKDFQIVEARFQGPSHDRQKRLAPSRSIACSAARAEFMAHISEALPQQMLACDFFTVESLRLETLYVLF